MGYQSGKFGNPGKEKRISNMEERDRRMEKSREAKATKENQIGYLEQFYNKKVKINLVNGEVLTGKFHSNMYNKYEYELVEENLGLMILRKEVVAYIRLQGVEK